MSTNLQDYIEVLNAEQHVQVDKLKENARHGIAPRVRGEVWLYLLNVLSEDKTTEITTIMALASTYQLLSSSLPSTITSLLLKTALQHHTRRFFNPTYADLISSLTAESPTHSGPIDAPNKFQAQPYTQGNGITNQSTSLTHTHNQNGSTSGLAGSNSFGSGSIDIDETLTLRSQYGRFLPPPPTTPPTRQAFLAEVEEVLGKFWHAENDAGRDGEWRRRRTGIDGSEREWVWLVTPFVCCLTRPVAVFLGFQGLMQRMQSFPPIPHRLASFLTLFRRALPDLFNYFEDEQVQYVDVAMSWMATLFSKEMWLENVLRLWDAYLAAEDMFELHCYVSVAVLATCKETLEELDGSETKLMLLDLPPFDIDRLLQDAANLRATYSLPRPIAD